MFIQALELCGVICVITVTALFVSVALLSGYQIFSTKMDDIEGEEDE